MKIYKAYKSRKEAKEAYQKTYGNNTRSFEKLEELFSSYTSFRSIAKQFKISGERVRQLHVIYFSSWHTFNSGKERQRSNTASKNLEKLILNGKSVPLLVRLRKLLKQRNIEVHEAASLYNSSIPHTNMCVIENAICRIHESETTFKIRKRNYWRFSISKNPLGQTEFTILLTKKPAMCFVLPNSELLKRFDKQKYKTFYVPTKPPSGYNNIMPVMNYWLYKDKWEQLTIKD